MYIKGRGRNALIMSIVWIIVPIITAVYISSGRMGNELIIIMLIGAMIHFLGVIVYTGSYGAMAGFNTMSNEEIKEYNMEKITSFLGILFVIGSYMYFLILIICLEITDIGSSIVYSILTTLMIILTGSVYSGVGKRFKAQN